MLDSFQHPFFIGFRTGCVRKTKQLCGTMDKVVSHFFIFAETTLPEEMSGSLYHICTGLSLTTKWIILKLKY